MGWKTVPCHRVDLRLPSLPVPRFPRPGPGQPFPAPPTAPSLAAGPLAAGSRARADAEGQAPAHNRPRAASQTRREGSALYGLRAWRKCLVGPREEAPYMARGGRGRGRAGGGEPAREGGRFRRLGPKPQRATPTCARAYRPCPGGGPRPPPAPSSRNPAPAPGVFSVPELRELGAPAGRAAEHSSLTWTLVRAVLNSQPRHGHTL